MPAWVTETKELEEYFGLRDCDGNEDLREW